MVRFSPRVGYGSRTHGECPVHSSHNDNVATTPAEPDNNYNNYYNNNAAVVGIRTLKRSAN